MEQVEKERAESQGGAPRKAGAARKESIESLLAGLEDLARRVRTERSWIRARDEGVTLTFFEREKVQRDWAEIVLVARKLANAASRAGWADGHGAETAVAAWSALAGHGARLASEIGCSRRLRTMLNERAPGIHEERRSFDRLLLLLRRAERKARSAGPFRRGARTPSKKSQRGSAGPRGGQREGGRKKAHASGRRPSPPRAGLLHLLVLAPLALLASRLYHFLARRLVGGGWHLYSKLIDFHRRFPIQPEQIRLLRSKLMPGDILVRRREVITTVFIPGYWTHMILYLGSFEEAARFFDTAEVEALFRSMGYEGFADCVARRRPHALAAWRGRNFIDGTRNIVLEATANGVVLNSERQALTANSIGAMRMRISRPALALGIVDALGTVGRDFNYAFSFDRYENLACTQVVSTAFAPGPSEGGEKEGVTFRAGPIRSLGLKRHGISPNEVVRQLAEQPPGAGRLEWVFFLRGLDGRHETVVGDEETFRQSHLWGRQR